MATPSWQQAIGRTSSTPTPQSSGGVKASNFGADYFLDRMFSASDIKGRVVTVYGEEGCGKTVLAAKMGKSNLFISDDNGILSFGNHPELDAISVAVPFEGYGPSIELISLCEAGKIIHPKTGKPVDNLVFDTISGMCSTEIRRSIEQGDIQTEKGVLAKNIPTQPHYLLSEQNFGPLMKEIGKVRNLSVTLLAHMRTGTKDIPGASSRADLHGASYKLMAKYSSVIGYMHEVAGSRMIRVMPGNMTAAKSRLNFGSDLVTDVDFVAKIDSWKNKQEEA